MLVALLHSQALNSVLGQINLQWRPKFPWQAKSQARQVKFCILLHSIASVQFTFEITKSMFTKIYNNMVSAKLIKEHLIHTNDMTEVVPERRAAPSTVLICEDVYNLLYELGGCDIIPVLGGPDQVIAHLLLVSFLSGILSTLRLQTKENKKQVLLVILLLYAFICIISINTLNPLFKWPIPTKLQYKACTVWYVTYKLVTWRHKCVPVLPLPEKNAVHQTRCRKQSTLHH